MSREALSIPPVLAFADPERDLWGVAAGREQALAAVGRLSHAGRADPEPAQLELTPSGEWWLRRGSATLSAAAQMAGARRPEGDPDLGLVRVSGELLGLSGDEPPGTAGGIAHPGRPQLRADSARLLCAWFSSEAAIAYLAIRPGRARGHDGDEASVACIGEPEGVSVFDPRLSSTYGDTGLMRRVGVELWMGDSEEADQYSLRMAGEATGASARLEVDGLSVQAQPFVCHSRGHSGVGVYVLIARS